MEGSVENSARGHSTGILPSWGYGTTSATKVDSSMWQAVDAFRYPLIPCAVGG
ncbi:MAG: hypothetical protein KGM47_16565 [Acidobacteriota bacterium]|nr:hypothetical protein [Acidobacteriota bacterium]